MINQKTQIILLTISIFMITSLAILSPVIGQVFGANNTQDYFNISLVISNSAPTMGSAGDSSGTPTEATTTSVSVLFNVSDPNGNSDVDPTQAYVNITYGAVTRESSSCQNYAAWTTGNNRGINCTINMYYYDTPGEWNISVRAQDSNPTIVSSNDAATFTYGGLAAFSLSKNSITFSSEAAGTNNINSSNDPQVLNNTGNEAFTYINITGHELSNGVDTIGAGNFTVNATDDAKGTMVSTNVIIPGASLSTESTQDIYVWVDIPTGIEESGDNCTTFT